MGASVVYPGVPLALIVDDEPAVRMYVTTILRGEDFHTLEAEDGAEALEIVEDLGGGVDLIVTDIQMPNGDGLTLANAVTKSFPVVPVILVSGSAKPDVAFEFVKKPFSPNALLQAVRKVCRRANRFSSKTSATPSSH